MGGWWVADYWQTPSMGPVWVVSWLVWVVGSIVLHELAHGWAAIRLGDMTPKWTGHLTWNPMVHMGPYSLFALAIFGIAWGAMPVDPSRQRGRHAEALVAAAGPAMNLVLAAVALLGVAFWYPLADGRIFSSLQIDGPLRLNMQKFFVAGARVNLLLMLFNLLPVLPLDGGRIATHYIRSLREFYQTEHGMWIGWGVFILFFFFGIDQVAGVSWTVIDACMDLGQSLTGARP